MKRGNQEIHRLQCVPGTVVFYFYISGDLLRDRLERVPYSLMCFSSITLH